MKYDDLLKSFSSRPFFETADLLTLFPEDEAQILPRLSRWVAAGKLVRLRRGKYMLPPITKTRRLTPSMFPIICTHPRISHSILPWNITNSSLNIRMSFKAWQPEIQDTGILPWGVSITTAWRQIGSQGISLSNWGIILSKRHWLPHLKKPWWIFVCWIVVSGTWNDGVVWGCKTPRGWILRFYWTIPGPFPVENLLGGWVHWFNT